MKKRVIICGFGFMGQNHAANIFNSSTLELAGVVDVLPKEKQKPVSGNLDCAKFDWTLLEKVPFYSTLKEALDNCAFDAAVICTPTTAHAEGFTECVKMGKSVFIEKPFCANTSEAAGMIAAAEEKNVTCHVGHCLRFLPEYSFLKSVCKSEKYGKLKYLKLLRKTGVPSWGAWKDKDTSISSVSGPVFDLNIHDIDMALYIAGEPQSVSARRTPGADRLFSSLWSYSDGLGIEIEGGFADQSAYPFRSGYTAVFEKAIIEYNSLSSIPVQISTDSGCVPAELPADDAYQIEIQAFADALNGTSSEHCSIKEAALAVSYGEKIISLLK